MSRLQHAVVCRDNICFFSIFILSRQSFLCRDRSFVSSLILCLARSFILSILCRDNLICVYWNSYVATLTIVLRHCLCAASSNLCHNQVFMLRPSFYVATPFLLVLVATMFLVLLAFLLRPGKSVATESCLHLT